MITGDLLALGPADLAVPTLGAARFPSPMQQLLGARRQSVHWVDETDRVLLDDTRAMAFAREVSIEELPAFDPAGQAASY